jgi:hypothetical protein
MRNTSVKLYLLLKTLLLYKRSTTKDHPKHSGFLYFPIIKNSRVRISQNYSASRMQGSTAAVGEIFFLPFFYTIIIRLLRSMQKSCENFATLEFVDSRVLRSLKTALNKLITPRIVESLLFVGFLVVLVISSILYLTSSVHAASGINEQINFQGKIVAASGGMNIANGNYDIEFKVHNHDSNSGGGIGACSGSCLWREAHDNVSVTDGIFRVNLGSLNAFGSNIDWNSDTLYLSIRVNADGATSEPEMSPRVRFSAVPYAFNAKQVNGLTVTNSSGDLTAVPGATGALTLTTSGNAKGLTLNTAAGSSGNSGGITIQSGNTSTSGTSGSVSVDVGSGASGNGSISIGTTNASGLTIGRNGVTTNVNGLVVHGSTQTSGTIHSISDSTAIDGAIIGQSISLTGSGAFDQTGLKITLSGASGTNLNAIVVNDGTNDTAKLSKSGILTLGLASTIQGGLVLANTSANSVTLRASNSTDAATTYVLPPNDGTNGDCLKTDAGGATVTLSWGNCVSSSAFARDTSGSPSFIYPSADATDDFVLGAATVANATFYVDVSAGALYLGKNETTNGLLTFYSSGVGETDPSIFADSDGDLNITAPSGTVDIGTTSGDIEMSLLTVNDNFIGDKTISLAGAYSQNDFTFKRVLTSNAGGETQAGSVLYIEDSGDGTGTTVNGSLLKVNSALTAGTFTGNLFTAQVGSSDKFVVNYDGTLTISNSGTTTDVTTGTDQNLTLLANGTGFISLNDTVKISTLTNSKGIVYLDDANGTLTSLANSISTGECLKSNSGAAPSWAACGSSSSLSGITAATTSDTDNDNLANAISWAWNSLTTEDAFSLTSDSGITSGRVFNVTSSATANFTGALQRIALTDGTGANSTTGTLLTLSNLGTSNRNTSLFIDHRADSANNSYALRVDDSSSDTTPFVINGDGDVGIGDTTPDALFDIDSSATTTNIAGITSTTLTTGEILDITATWAPTGGGTQSAVDINLTNNNSSSANTFRGLDIALTDAVALGNTNYGSYIDVANTGVTSSAKNIYGIYSTASNTGAGGGTQNVWAGYFSATGDAGGSSTATGIYATAAGADSNIAGYFDGRAIVTAPNTSGAVLSATGNSLTTGQILNLSSSSTAITSGDFLFAQSSTTFTTTSSYSGNLVDLDRQPVGSGVGTTLTVSGALMEITDNCFGLSSGVCTHTASVIDLTQSYTSSTGTAVYFKNYGAGDAFRVDDASGDTSPFIIDASGNVGIGDSIPTEANLSITGSLDASDHMALGGSASVSSVNLLNASETFTSFGTQVKGINNSLILNPSGAVSNGPMGSYTSVTIQAANAQDFTKSTRSIVGSGGYAFDNGTGTVTDGRGGDFSFETTSSANITTARGVYGLVGGTGTGTITTAIGGDFVVNQDTGAGNITTAYGVRGQASIGGTNLTTTDAIGGYFQADLYAGHDATNLTGLKTKISQGHTSSAITNGYGLYVDTPGVTTAATFALNYGIYIADQTGPTASYALVTAGGNVGIGDTTPSSQLEIGDGTDSIRFSTVGDITFFDENSSSSITGPNGGSLTLASANSQDLILDSSSNVLTLAATDTTLKRTASGIYTIDLVDSADTTLSLTNSNVTAGVDVILRIDSLTNGGLGCDTIDTDGSGNLICGTDAGAAASPFNTSGGVITKATAGDVLSLRYGDAADTQFEIENTTTNTIPTADAMVINLSGNTTGIVTDGVDGLFIRAEFGDEGTNQVNSALHLDVDPVAIATSDDTFYGVNIDGLSAGTSAAEAAINIGTNWDTYLNTSTIDITGAGAIIGATGISSSGTITFSGLTNCGELATDSSGNVLCNSGTGDTVEAIDSTPGVTADDDITEIFNDSAPSVTPLSTSQTVMVSASVKFTSSGTGDNQAHFFRVVREDDAASTNPSCDGTDLEVGQFSGGWTTNTSIPVTAVGVFLDNPSSTAAVYYTICSDADSVWTNIPTMNSATLVLVELGADLAENYYTTDDSIDAGTVVTMDSSLPAGIKKSSAPYEGPVLGVISTAPGKVLDDWIGRSFGRAVPVALSGRVPIKVSTENGVIKAGDYLTTSSISGIAMKSTRPGPVIAKAMTDFNAEGVGKVLGFVNTSYADPTGLLSDLVINSDGTIISKKAIQSLTNLTNSSEEPLGINLENLGQGLTESNKLEEELKELIASQSAELVNLKNTVDQYISSTSAQLAKGLIFATDSSKLTSDSLEVKNESIFYGMVQFLDSLTARNLIVTEWARFLSEVLFKGEVEFEGRATFNKDTAGFALIKQGVSEVEVKFEKEYAQIPLINASITLDDNLSEQDKALLGPKELQEKIASQSALEEQILASDIKYIITKRTVKSFFIKLNKPAPSDIKFSWSALSIKDASLTESEASVAGEVTASAVINDEVTASPSASLKPEELQKITINKNELGFLRVRAEPSSTSEELGEVKPLEIFEVVETSEPSKATGLPWYKIEFEKNKFGWVSGAYVTLNEPEITS